MTDKELIKAEIESRIQECKDSKIDSSYYDGLIFAFEEVRDFINSLPEEPVSKVWHDVREIPKFDRMVVFHYIDGVNSCQYSGQSMKGVLDWCYLDDLLSKKEEPDLNWKDMSLQEKKDLIDSLKKDVEEPVSEELEEAAIEICSKVLEGETILIDGYEYVVLSDAEECFKAGTKWQKEQMIKSVLASQEMTCIQVAHRLIGSSWNLACPTDKIGLKSNDKVKVIIIKGE